jgi:hypothetical protein
MRVLYSHKHSFKLCSYVLFNCVFQNFRVTLAASVSPSELAYSAWLAGGRKRCVSHDRLWCVAVCGIPLHGQSRIEAFFSVVFHSFSRANMVNMNTPIVGHTM